MVHINENNFLNPLNNKDNRIQGNQTQKLKNSGESIFKENIVYKNDKEQVVEEFLMLDSTTVKYHWTYEYDANGNLVKEQMDGNDEEGRRGADGIMDIVDTYEYENNRLVKQETDFTGGGENGMSIDGKPDRVKIYKYNNDGELIRIEHYNGDSEMFFQEDI